MQLSQFFPLAQIVRDTEFSMLALSNSAPGGPFMTFLEDVRFLEEINHNGEIVAVICKPELLEQLSSHISGVVLSAQPRVDFFTLHNQLSRDERYHAPLAPSIIAPGSKISPFACIDPFGVVIEEGVEIEPFCVIKGPCRIGRCTVIHSGVKIGGAGFEFKRLQDRVLDVAHCGSVEIGENVVIWENVTIHKAVYPWDRTEIGHRCRIGAHCHIDHGAKLGAFSELCAGAIVSGRAVLGEWAYLGPGAIVSNRVQLGDAARASLGSVVTRDAPAHETVTGNFAIAHKRFLFNLKKSLEE